jgi:hypothetical protein
LDIDIGGLLDNREESQRVFAKIVRFFSAMYPSLALLSSNAAEMLGGNF